MPTYTLVIQFRNCCESQELGPMLRRQVFGLLNDLTELMTDTPEQWDVQVHQAKDRYNVTVANVPVSALSPQTLLSLVQMAAKAVSSHFVPLPVPRLGQLVHSA